MKYDVLIPTKDPKKIRPKLLEVLESSPYVKDIIIETSRPLSKARKVGALKCSTEWIAMFDDDVEIPECWFEVVSRKIKIKDVVSISTVFQDYNIHLSAYDIFADKIKPLHLRGSPYICNTMIRRSIFYDYEPPNLFYGEDEFLYRHAKSKGEWLCLPYIGVRHFYVKKDNVKAGATMAMLGFYPNKQWLRGVIIRFLLSFPTIAYSHTPTTVKFHWEHNIETISGVLKARIFNKKLIDI